MHELETEDYDAMKIIGDEAYQEFCKSRRRIDQRKGLDEILLDTGVSDRDYNYIKCGSRKRHLADYKHQYVKKALELKYTMQQIADNITMTRSAIVNITNRDANNCEKI